MSVSIVASAWLFVAIRPPWPSPLAARLPVRLAPEPILRIMNGGARGVGAGN